MMVISTDYNSNDQLNIVSCNYMCVCIRMYVNIALFYNIDNAHHLQLRAITQNVNKQVVSSENESRSPTTENVIQSVVHKLRID